MKLSEYDEVISAYETYISDFWYRWPQVRSFLRPPHYKSMGKKSTLLYLLWRKRFWVEWYRIGQLWTIRVKNCITYPSKGHLRSPEVTNRHLPITFDQKEIETWDWCQYVRLGQANLVMCNMTYFGHHVTLDWLDLRSNFNLDLSKSFYIWFDAPYRDKHDGIKFVALSLKLKILLSKNRFGKFWNFDPWRPQFWPEPKNDRNYFEMIFYFFFGYALRCEFGYVNFECCLSFFSTATRSRDHGGGRSNAPPPPAGGGKSRGPAGRGLNPWIDSFWGHTGWFDIFHLSWVDLKIAPIQFTKPNEWTNCIQCSNWIHLLNSNAVRNYE